MFVSIFDTISVDDDNHWYFISEYRGKHRLMDTVPRACRVVECDLDYVCGRFAVNPDVMSAFRCLEMLTSFNVGPPEKAAQQVCKIDFVQWSLPCLTLVNEG